MLTYFIITYLASLLHHKVPVPTYPAPVIPLETLERVKSFTVLISNEGIGGVSRGTGVLIDSTHVLTCAHMIEPASQPWVYTYPLKQVQSVKHIAYVNQSHDVAIFELEKPVKLSSYAVFNATTTIGQPIVVVGNTMGLMMWFTSYGMISEKEFFYDLTTATIHGGNSGGPWVDLNGYVVALTDWGMENKNGQEEMVSGGINGETLIADVNAFRHPPDLFKLLFGQ